MDILEIYVNIKHVQMNVLIKENVIKDNVNALIDTVELIVHKNLALKIVQVMVISIILSSYIG